MKPRDEQHYRQRVARVVAAIVADPMAGHGLEDLARIAHFSPFHFHRIYRSIAEETVTATIRRVRLALATRLLEEGRLSITEVALTVGYDSPQAFTRAFGQFAGQSPTAFQQQMHNVILDAHAGGEMPAVQMVERAAMQVYALRHIGPPSTIPHTHRRLRRHVGQRPVLAWLGVCSGHPEQAESFSYHAAAATPEPWPEQDGLQVLDLPAGCYAQHCLVGPYSRIDAAVNALFSRWLPGSGFEPDDRPILEHYLNSPSNTPQAELRTHLLIPVRSRSAV